MLLNLPTTMDIFMFLLTKDEVAKNVQIAVEDNGVGMTETAVEHAFELFYQGEYENYKGSGLGLALAKELILCIKEPLKFKAKNGKEQNLSSRFL